MAIVDLYLLLGATFCKPEEVVKLDFIWYWTLD